MQRRLQRKENDEWEDYDLAHALMAWLVDNDEWEGPRSGRPTIRHRTTEG